MVKLWKEQGPPVHIAVAGYLGLIPKSTVDKVDKEKKDSGNLNELEAMFSNFGGMIG